MFDLDSLVSELRRLFLEEYDLKQRFDKLRTDVGENPSYQEIYSSEEQLRNHINCTIGKQLEKFLRYPPCHIRHKHKLEEFHSYGTYHKSVFIMTKLPEGNSELDGQLLETINTVSASVKMNGFIPRLASADRYHPQLWDNVELHLLGCCKGIAIVEDRYKPELNPNVAMEWGWMRAMGKEVCYLVEEKFDHDRADWLGLIKSNFLWETPEDGIESSITDWLSNSSAK